MIEEDINIGEEKFQFKKENISINQIILRHITKISDLCCQEMKEGYWDEKPAKVGDSFTIIKSYHPDGRKGYINSMDFLLTMVMPYASDDETNQFQKALNQLQDEEDKEYQLIKKNKQDENKWIDRKLELKKKLFLEIMLFLNRINFFSSEDYAEQHGST